MSSLAVAIKELFECESVWEKTVGFSLRPTEECRIAARVALEMLSGV